ncbi:MAG TPA: hypothetical protein VFS29_06775 [Motilibacteraceae bacterium]|nr:hypothetical protein [Motilibacteraceae bacterium]
MERWEAVIRLVERHGFRLQRIGPAEAMEWEVAESAGAPLARPTRLRLHSEAAVQEYVRGFRHRAASDSEQLELATMGIVEDLETVDVLGRPAFRLVGLELTARGEVRWVQERYPGGEPPPGGPDLEWRATP